VSKEFHPRDDKDASMSAGGNDMPPGLNNPVK
jgi:hypothetical protein